MSQPTASNSTSFSNNTKSFNNNYVWNNYTIADDRSQLLAWLSPLEPKIRHRDIQEHRVDNVGEWLMQTEEFRTWHGGRGEGEGGNAVLFCYGAPGVGKTFISSLVVDRLCDQSKEQNTAVTCFYFDFAARKEQSVTNMLGSLLKQIVGGMAKVPEEILGAFKEQRMAIGGRGPRLPDIVKMLQTIASSLHTFICIDALDECAAVHRVKLLDSLRQILEKAPRTRIFIIARPHIRAEVEKRLAKRVISVFAGPSRDDIIGYLRVRLGEDETPDAMDESLAADIMEKIPENVSEMFLLVSLNMDAILNESTIHRRRERLSKMIGGLELGDVYSGTIERIKAQSGDKSRLGMAALMWISHAERPLRMDELCHALAVELGSTDFSVGNIPSISTLVSSCQGLITVDKEASTVRLIHFTLQEYFSTHLDIFSRPHSAMAEICLTYLNSQQVKTLSTAPWLVTESASFLEYCSAYWGVHAKKELSGCGRSLVLELLKGHYSQVSTWLLLTRTKHFHFWEFKSWSPFSGLHCASFFGIVEVVATLIEVGCYGIDEEDFSGRTPLSWAACNGHEGVVKILLERGGVNPGRLDKSGQTSLSYAARSGHERVVKILLGREEVNADKPDNDGRTPLLHAASSGREGVVKILLGEEKINADRPDLSGQTPLSYAARGGHEGVVKILLEREEVNADKPDNYGRTPLSFAAIDGREGVVKILLGEEKVNADRPDLSGQTPLSYAARGGHEGVVKMLLEREEVNADKPDSDGETPLLRAASSGREGVVKMLLGREGVNPAKPDNYGNTPLLCAARGGHEGVVKMLLGREEVNPDKPDNYGQTPLSHAALSGREGVVKILLGEEKVNADKPNRNGRTPLSCAASAGHEGVVKMLLRREEVNADKPDNDGRTPLGHAIGFGKKRVAALLQSRKAVAPSTI